MKIISSLTFLIFFFCNCENGNKTIHSKKAEPSKTSDSTSLKAIDLKYWSKTPVIAGRIATKADMVNGLAIFCIDNKSKQHTPYYIQLPRLAYLKDENSKKEELVIIVQVEKTSSDTVVGYRNLKGGIGACKFYEIRLLNDEEIKQVVGD